MYTKDSEGGWKLYDESVCTILIYKQPLQEKYRVVAMTSARKVKYYNNIIYIYLFPYCINVRYYSI